MLKPEKLYYRIGEVAKMFGIKTSLIRYWEKEFSIIRPKKTKNGLRLFTRKDIDHFELIYHLIKEKGMTINGAREYIKTQQEQNNLDKLEVINTLKRTKAFLQDIKALLDKRKIIKNIK
jgi:DNA-binding transcriptional MerR regulator